MLRISSYTFGCKLSHSETDSALAILSEAEYQVVPWDSGADLYLINTCTVTSKGEQKARRLIRQVQRLWPQAVVLAAGCYAVLEQKKLESLGSRVLALPDQPAKLCELLAGNQPANSDELLVLLRQNIAQNIPQGLRQLKAGVPRKVDFPEVLLQNKQQNKREAQPNIPRSPKISGKFKSPPRDYPKRQRYFLKIQDGCNRSCSFCRIRIARGPSRSLGVPELVSQLQELEGLGYAEAVITGVHINSYHHTSTEGCDYYLGGLLQELLRNTQKIRLRLSSLEPEDLENPRARALFQALASERICPHFHISLQSGSEHVLRQMRRSYTAGQQERYIEKLKMLRPAAFFACDVIVGFPGEREEDFQATCELLRSKEFSAVHGFSYSPRPDTEAFAMPKVQESIIKDRMIRLQDLGRHLQETYIEHCRGQEADILLEELCDGYWLGYSENYVRTHIWAQPGWQSGDLIKVRLQEKLQPKIPSNGELEGIPCGY